MYYFFIFILFLLGLVLGSFLNALIYRIKVGKKVTSGRSICPKCKKQLSFWDLVPVFSFIFLHGRCRQCHQKISWQYPLVELATGLIFVLIYYYQFLVPKAFNPISILSLLFYLFIASILIVIFVYDLRYSIIPDKVIWPGIIISLVYCLLGTVFYFSGQRTIFYQLFHTNYYLTPNPFFIILGALIAGGFFLGLILLSHGKWMGGGDVKLGILMGLVLGFPQVIIALFIAFIFGSLISLFLVFQGKKNWKSQIPFGPFLVFGFFIALFWGGIIINWYLSLLF